jgi:hypothetical protein
MAHTIEPDTIRASAMRKKRGSQFISSIVSAALSARQVALQRSSPVRDGIERRTRLIARTPQDSRRKILYGKSGRGRPGPKQTAPAVSRMRAGEAPE